MQALVKRYLRSAFFGMAALLTPVFAPTASASILPPNNLHLQDDINRKDVNVTEVQFNEIVDRIIAYYQPIVASHGGVLTAQKAWADPTVNAYAQQEGTNWYVKMFGGLARRPEVSLDGFALVVCHELGHHLGGFAFYDATGWAASEGQSDYFATQSCARQIWGDDKVKNAESRPLVSGLPKTNCDAAWQGVDDQNLCYRTVLGGETLARLLAALGGETVSFATPSRVVQTTTMTAHPPAQCRLDTYFQGSLCAAVFDSNVIPGRNQADGQLSRNAELVAMRNSCLGYSRNGSRPKCWFAPRVNSFVTVADWRLTEISGNNDGALDPGEIFDLSLLLANEGSSAYFNIQASASSVGSSLVIDQARSDFPNLAAGTQVWQAAPFRVHISRDATCGATLPIQVNLTDGAFADEFSHSIKLGKEVATPQVSTTPAVDIPDSTDAGIQSAVTVAAPGSYQTIEISVDITHPYVGDLVVTLVGPDGQERMVHNRAGGASDNLAQTFSIVEAGTTSAGVWTLKVADKAASDIGKLNSWGIRFKTAQCSRL